MKTVNEPHAKSKNRPAFMDAPRCGAKTRKGAPCKAPAMVNGRCRMHGGKSTGPKTPEGLEQSRKANWRHGLYSAEARKLRDQMKQLLSECQETFRQIDSEVHG